MTVLEEWLQVKERKNWIIKGTLVNVVHYLNHNYQFYIDLNKLHETYLFVLIQQMSSKQQ